MSEDIRVTGVGTPGRFGRTKQSMLSTWRADLVLKDGRILKVEVKALNRDEAVALVTAKFPLAVVKSVKKGGSGEGHGTLGKVWSVVRPPTASELHEAFSKQKPEYRTKRTRSGRKQVYRRR